MNEGGKKKQKPLSIDKGCRGEKKGCTRKTHKGMGVLSAKKEVPKTGEGENSDSFEETSVKEGEKIWRVNSTRAIQREKQYLTTAKNKQPGKKKDGYT